MINFNERNFLIRALVGVFLVQFATVFYQIYSCQTAIRSPRESEKVAEICSSASASFNETGKLALTTFLALLVPSGSQAASGTTGQSRVRRKVKATEAEPSEEEKVG